MVTVFANLFNIKSPAHQYSMFSSSTISAFTPTFLLPLKKTLKEKQGTQLTHLEIFRPIKR